MIGKTYLDEPIKEKRHLRIVIAEKDNNYLVLVVDTYHKKPYEDDTCLLLKGEHPFLTKDISFINYKYSQVITFQQYYNGIHKGLLIPKEDLSEELLNKILNKTKTAKYLKNDYKKMFFATKKL